MKKCYYCAEEIDDNLQECPYCGHELLKDDEKLCPYCSEIIKKDAIYCRFCNRDLNINNNNNHENLVEYDKDYDDNIIYNNDIKYDEEEFDVIHFLFSLNGRVGKKEFFKYIGVEFLTAFISGFIVVFMKMSKEQMDMFFAIVSLIFLYPNIAVTAKRAHDFNYSGWLSLVTLAPYIGFILMLAIGFIEGDPKENKYGLPKKKS